MRERLLTAKYAANCTPPLLHTQPAAKLCSTAATTAPIAGAYHSHNFTAARHACHLSRQQTFSPHKLKYNRWTACLAGGGLLGATRGDLYTWGGEFTWVDQKKDKAGHVTTKRDSHKGCLGLGDADGRLTPTRYIIFLHNFVHNPAQLCVHFSLAQPCTTFCATPTHLCVYFSHAVDGYDLMIIKCLTATMLFHQAVLGRFAVLLWLESVACQSGTGANMRGARSRT